MYYLITINLTKKLRIFTTFLFLSIIVFTFHSISFADVIYDTAEDYRTKGYQEQQKGNFDKALGYYSKALSLGLESAVLYNDIGVLYEQLGVPDAAEGYYLKAVRVNEDYAPTYTNLAYFYLERGNNERAIAFFQERLKRTSDDDPWQDRIRKELNKLDPGIKKEAVKTDLEKINQARVQEARDEFNLQILRSEKHYQKGRQYLAEKNFDEAITEFDRALAVTPNNPKILKVREQTLYEQNIENIKGRMDEAMQKLDSGEVESAKEEIQQILTTIPNESNHESK